MKETNAERLASSLQIKSFFVDTVHALVRKMLFRFTAGLPGPPETQLLGNSALSKKSSCHVQFFSIKNYSIKNQNYSIKNNKIIKNLIA